MASLPPQIGVIVSPITKPIVGYWNRFFMVYNKNYSFQSGEFLYIVPVSRSDTTYTYSVVKTVNPFWGTSASADGTIYEDLVTDPDSFNFQLVARQSETTIFCQNSTWTRGTDLMQWSGSKPTWSSLPNFFSVPVYVPSSMLYFMNTLQKVEANRATLGA